jgi:hypothetical protein
MPRYRVTLYGRDHPALMELVRKHKLTLDVFPHTLRQLDDGGYSVEVLADGGQIRSLIEAKAVEPRALRASGFRLNSALRAPHGQGVTNFGEPKRP